MTGIEMTRNEMLDMLRTSICTVSFTKVNGETRDMKCTLIENFIPEKQRPSGNLQNIQYSEEVIRVFDVDKQEWRSFKVNLVNSIQISK
jgi:hypothetical protein